MANRKFTEVGSFKEEFHDFKKSKVLEGVYKGLMTKKIDGEDRNFAAVLAEGNDKVQLAAGRDLLNKVANLKEGDYARITFEGEDTFTPKGTKKKVKINRYKVEVAS